MYHASVIKNRCENVPPVGEVGINNGGAMFCVLSLEPVSIIIVIFAAACLSSEIIN
jgi:hypothetical protein